MSLSSIKYNSCRSEGMNSISWFYLTSVRVTCKLKKKSTDIMTRGGTKSSNTFLFFIYLHQSAHHQWNVVKDIFKVRDQIETASVDSSSTATTSKCWFRGDEIRTPKGQEILSDDRWHHQARAVRMYCSSAIVPLAPEKCNLGGLSFGKWAWHKTSTAWSTNFIFPGWAHD